MSFIIPAVCAALAIIILMPILGRLLKYRAGQLPTEDEVNRAEFDLHVKHLARMNGKRGDN